MALNFYENMLFLAFIEQDQLISMTKPLLISTQNRNKDVKKKIKNNFLVLIFLLVK